jgi:uncharacterized sulfatase
MTGRYSARVGAWAVTEGRQLLNPDEVTMAEVFQDSGYRTGMFGKWHLGDTWPFAPRYRGFQRVVRHLAGGIDEIGNPIGNDYFDDTYHVDGKLQKLDGYCTEVFFDECMKFIKQESEKPFFVYLPLNAMHSPHTVAEKYSAAFLEAGHRAKRAKFFGQIINFDENLGRLFGFLENHQLDDNTILIFMGDNGTAAGDADARGDFNAGMRGKKGSVYEGGHRVACFARWPNKLKAGTEVTRLTSVRDWLPTLIDYCDLKGPAGVRFDGKSIRPLFESNGEDWPQRTMFVERQSDQPSLHQKLHAKGGYPQYAVMSGTWRMVNGQLFNMSNDFAQAHNVAGDNPDVVMDLRGQYENYFADVFSDNAAYTRFQVGAPEQNPMLLTVRDWHPTKGNVIWQQHQLDDDNLQINGFWAIEIVNAGRYSIRLSRFPDDDSHAMRASKAVLQIGEQRFEKTIDRNASSVSFDMTLDVASTLVQTSLQDDQSGTRGAYFVEIERISRSNQTRD